jgi:hypothetical protein
MVIGELSRFVVLHLQHYYSIQMITATEAHAFTLKQQFNKGQLIVFSGQSGNQSPVSCIGF